MKRKKISEKKKMGLLSKSIILLGVFILAYGIFSIMEI
tara:strand:- start:1232 stop:1345 length:114 start_codon:yes stop_codon:yes gene_type:complete